MLQVRRTLCSKTTHYKARSLLSYYARSQSAVPNSPDVKSATLDNVILTPGNHWNGYRRPQTTLSPHELLRQLRPSNVEPDQTWAAYDADNIKRMREIYVTPASRVGSQYYKVMEEMRQIETEALTIGREIARRCRDATLLRRAFRYLFGRCHTVRDIVHVLAIAFQRTASATELQYLSYPIIRALFRARVYATDLRIFSLCYAFILRMEKAGLAADDTIFNHCALFAARSRDPKAMQRALWLFRSRGVNMTFKAFRAIIAKFSIGRNGYGELRNGRWKREDVLSVLLGFDGTHIKGGNVPDHHLGSFLKRDEWGYVIAWLQILGRCRTADLLWEEWITYRSVSLDHPILRGHNSRQSNPERRRERLYTIFIDQMLIAGDVSKAWAILHESKLDFWSLEIETRAKLFDNAEDLHLAIAAFENRDSLKTALLEKYTYELERIERALGIAWRSDGKGGGRHVVPSLEEMELRFEELSRPDFGRVYGYFSEPVDD
ncbi:uncharacterized protein PV09_04430 [Verruconis gallopava]|uniref:Uncharacterized protein n=1 Tax=Verruconis gallopava TaxID=253628 RepID=A0A0D1XQ40_9PEZI|nr:uncharacterized protein PV09_04430 [Verruconis gallopava]KIW04696.1 hypothetical protein PV09_04430 [Verruconis gallopava]